jgi:HD-GYP domain-containing protein (c-di-GMP phosphodiesterase class II)
MRRVSIAKANPGMRLELPIYGQFGKALLTKGVILTENHIAALDRMGIPEIFIEDDLTDDLPVWPLFKPEIEAAMVAALRHLLALTQKMIVSGNYVQLDLNSLFQLTYEMTCHLIPAKLGDIYIGGNVRLNDYDVVHPVKVCSLAMVIGNALGLPRQSLIELGVAALLENIGQLLTPRDILAKPGLPTEEELKLLKEHSLYSAAIVKGYGLTPPRVAVAVLQHHERWSGEGYPSGIKGDHIDLSARIIALADTYCALVSSRSYRTAFRPHQAAEFIKENRGKLFDPELVHSFIDGVPIYPPGIRIRLNTGETGVIVDPRVGILGRPKLRLYGNFHGNSIRPYEIDLAEGQYTDKHISEILEY